MVAEEGLPSGTGWSHWQPTAQGKGGRVIFHKHYITSFVGDKMFAKLCWKSGTSRVTTSRTAACSDRL